MELRYFLRHKELATPLGVFETGTRREVTVRGRRRAGPGTVERTNARAAARVTAANEPFYD